MSKFVNKEIDPEQVWINIYNGKRIRAVVLMNIYVKSEHHNIDMGVYRLEHETISKTKVMVDLAKEGEKNIRFYILEEVKEDNNDVTG